MSSQYRWWRRGVINQIYPRSFQDSHGDDVGDLPGIISRLDYVEWLGVNAIWLSPIYHSPMADFGYGIPDSTGIDPQFGLLDDFASTTSFSSSTFPVQEMVKVSIRLDRDHEIVDGPIELRAQEGIIVRLDDGSSNLIERNSPTN